MLDVEGHLPVISAKRMLGVPKMRGSLFGRGGGAADCQEKLSAHNERRHTENKAGG